MSDRNRSGLQQLLAQLPAVDELLHEAARRGLTDLYPRSLIGDFIRARLAEIKEEIIGRQTGGEEIFPAGSFWAAVERDLAAELSPRLREVINATGVVIHTNLGRSPLPDAAVARVAAVAGGYSNLEYDLDSGRRSIRYANVEELLCRLSGAEAAMVVNNNAGAVLLALSALAAGREVVVSRGELVEIGGAFRIPEIVVQGGAILKEVGATNRTHLADYETVIGEETALLLKVHTSNYRISGFSGCPETRELVALARRHGIPVIEDLGSGNLLDLRAYGLPGEPTVGEVISNGVDLATFSGDKLLGGPQAGIIVGRRELVEKLKKHPLNRALRIDKMTLAALEATLKCFLDPRQAVAEVPTLRMLTMGTDELRKRARRLRRLIRRQTGELTGLEMRIAPEVSRAGGGALPMVALPTVALFLRFAGKSPVRLEKALRQRSVPVIVRIVDDWLVFDPRTLLENDFNEIAVACRELFET
ncbi:MAG: L-seryl-tRNA(Sec) selenium transferase [Deltaproteobacteria bacterium]|nr:L-seryl-tRNA(Sec) selenium transferase [Deltaproteobacteria bacterium]